MALKHLTALFGTLFLVLAASAQGVRREPAFNPLQPAAHDPVAVRCGDTWYLFSTGFGISVLTSQDLKSWEPAGRVFDNPPQWALDTVPGYHGHTWAPDILYHGGTYYLYYSCSSFGKNDSAIGVATNRTLDPSSRAG